MCSMGPKQLLERVDFNLKYPFLRGVGRYVGTFLASNVTQVAVFSRWNGSYGSMGPGGHIKHLDMVLGAMTGAQWVRSDRLRGSILT